MAKNNLIGGSIWDEYSKVVQDRMNNPKFMGELTEEEIDYAIEHITKAVNRLRGISSTFAYAPEWHKSGL